MAFLRRPRLVEAIDLGIAESSVTALLGPRQAGKTTLAKWIAQQYEESHFYDLEDPRDDAQLQNPMMVLEPMSGLIVLDEIQRRPDLFPVLRVLADRGNASFLVLGSASPALVRGASESLAGRIRMIELSGFDLLEVGAKRWTNLWQRGGFPPSFLAESDGPSYRWRVDFIRTFLERDLANLASGLNNAMMRRLWTMLAHDHAQVHNASRLAAALGVSQPTVQSYVDVLEGAYMIRRLQPWFTNVRKRQVKSPKIYIRDSGILHALLQIDTSGILAGHPARGASWEGWVIEQVRSLAVGAQIYFWATHSGAELDLLLLHQQRKIGIECKASERPELTRSMGIAIADLSLDELWVVYPGTATFPLDERVTAMGPAVLAERLAS